MHPIPAIVLTCDAHHPFAEHMMLAYARVWPEHPLEFWVPYQKTPPRISQPIKAPLRSCNTPVNIKATVLSLLSHFEDDQWVYWCIDDKYPVSMDLKLVTASTATLNDISDTNIVGLSFIRVRSLLRKNNVYRDEEFDIGSSRTYLRRRYIGPGFWFHQFYRTKFLRYVFETFPDNIPYPKMMDRYMALLSRSNAAAPGAWRLYVTQLNGVVWGESTSRGRITANCTRSFAGYGLPIPPFPKTSANVTIGSLGILGSLRQKCSETWKIVRRKLKSTRYRIRSSNR